MKLSVHPWFSPPFFFIPAQRRPTRNFLLKWLNVNDDPSFLLRRKTSSSLSLFPFVLRPRVRSSLFLGTWVKLSVQSVVLQKARGRIMEWSSWKAKSTREKERRKNYYRSSSSANSDTCWLVLLTANPFPPSSASEFAKVSIGLGGRSSR